MRCRRSKLAGPAEGGALGRKGVAVRARLNDRLGERVPGTQVGLGMHEHIRHERQQLAIGGSKLRARVPSAPELQAADLLPGQVLGADFRKAQVESAVLHGGKRLRPGEQPIEARKKHEHRAEQDDRDRQCADGHGGEPQCERPLSRR